jgi:excisionase family DNA binding protein
MRARDAGTWLIVDATAEWCGPCKQMDKTTWRNDDVVRWIEANGLALQVDVGAESDLAKQLEIRAMPTVIAFKDGEENDRVVGYRDPKGLLVWMNGLTRVKPTLLSVRQAAERLGLCTATVYGLCADGALAHIRILNAIRIAPADLADFIATRRGASVYRQRGP